MSWTFALGFRSGELCLGLISGGLRRKGASVRVAHVTALVTGGFCPGLLHQKPSFIIHIRL